MKSISWKILQATLYWLIALTVLMTVVSVWVVNSITDNDSQSILTQACEKETIRFNSEFALIENSVSMITEYIKGLEEESSSTEEMLSEEFCSKIQDMTLSIANRTDGAMTVYFRYNPELTGNGTAGFFWSRNDDSEDFAYFEPTDILQYDQNDTEHVGWFYEPKKSREAMWMSPYYNKNLGVFMISYIVPYYTNTGDFLGVVGMDIDFDEIMRMTNNISLYENSCIKLIDLSTYKAYSCNDSNQVTEENLSTAVYNHITTIDGNEATLVTTDDSGKKIITVVNQLENSMRLMLYAPVSEVNAQRNNMLRIFAAIMVVILAVTVFYIVRLTGKMIRPLQTLTRITGKYAQGDWSETFISDTGDEIQELSESISAMAETTKSYIDRLNESSITDALTGLKNKNCYLSYIEKFGEEKGLHLQRYAVVVFDINYLKKMNDNYGHELGDELIKQAGNYICNVFSHSPVFRIGGDEYNAVLENSDYENREKLYHEFVDGMKDLPIIAGDISLSISIGMAIFPEDGMDYDTVFKCADERMYEYKKKMKVSRE